ncbi:uncharacterized protein LOC143180279 [Calliopsis andreniformis]|uniref:uncharacterized protein LOC143180279 n=1 Tax=Calliopsis andreniformis TaxID=337506 RepID=UPI003FCCECEA
MIAEYCDFVRRWRGNIVTSKEIGGPEGTGGSVKDALFSRETSLRADSRATSPSASDLLVLLFLLFLDCQNVEAFSLAPRLAFLHTVGPRAITYILGSLFHAFLENTET